MTALAVTRERENGGMESLLISPVTRMEVISVTGVTAVFLLFYSRGHAFRIYQSLYQYGCLAQGIGGLSAINLVPDK